MIDFSSRFGCLRRGFLCDDSVVKSTKPDQGDVLYPYSVVHNYLSFICIDKFT